ncbi:Response regulator receiver modulated metal dependent phosphohydrolase [uncultured Desulfobacterium sp.]|uniref:Response regulator receiver modulated metal dependent phosphohydrolase n=1 Tax=uncultured Desulfobacterium sp. TaxID=201089 RepID=A0A445N480_9BACT|nr:Response regulator receiver modulated metal dependent phosphohydrolase [uncultured Desulfobacterium sp.]
MTEHRVLIVDDSAMMRRAMRIFLEPLKLDVYEAVDGQMGLDMAFENNFDLIVTDVNMPNMDGVELCRRLKGEPSTRGIPVVMVSSFDSDSDIEKGFQVGAAAYISKKEVQTQALETISKILSQATLHSRQTILVVDDSKTIRKIVEEGLAQAGFKVATATNGKEALNIIKHVKPDLILSDIDMPEMNGFEFCSEVNSNPDLAAIPFVVMSSNSDRAHMKRMLQYGAEAYITKPFNTDQLVILVEKLLSDQFLLLLKEKERLDSEQSLMLASITSLVSALEARDSYTRGHSESVATIVGGMAGLMGANQEEINRIIIGGQLHDIGKIGVRDSVLLKPGALTDDEFSQIKVHPAVGAKILESIPSLTDIVSIVQCHHERMDGKGYPNGLKSKQIPLNARMTAVADTYNALTSDRPYRNGMPQEKALQIVNDAKGTQLCPDCVEIFFKWISSNKK